MNVFKYSWRDFKKQKVKAIFGIGGIFISVLLLGAVGILIDSLSFSYLDLATNQVGSADIMFSKTIQSDLTFDPFMDQDYIQSHLHVDQIDYYFPRIMMLANIDPMGDTSREARVIFYGINTTLEQNSSKMGDLIVCDPNTLQETDEVFQGPIPMGHAIILKNTAKLLNVTAGDWILATYTHTTVNLTIDAVCVQKLRFTIAETNLVITELPQAQILFDEIGKVNYIMATLKDREHIYDTRDIDGTIARIRKIGSEIQDQLGFDYQIQLPKVKELDISQMITMMMQMMMVFVSILSMMISAILINSILTTSIEERIREFGILRVLGSKRRDNVLIVLNQGIFMGLFGTAIGVIGAILAVPWLLDLLYSLVSWFSNPIPTIFLPQTIINTIIIGLASSIIISIWPALKASNLNIAQAVDPYRRKEEGWTLKKEGSANTRTIIMGIAISSVGLIIFILFPRIIVTQNFGLITSLFIALLLAVLIGLVFALLGIIPVLQWLILQVFKPFIRKYSPIVKLSLKRNRRRNTSNSLMFSLTFSFIFFNSSFLAIRHQMIADNLQFQYGADIVIINQGSPQAGTAIDLDFYSKLSKLQGIKSMAPIAHNTIDAAELLSLISSAQEQSMDIESLMPMFMNVFTNNKTKTYIGSVSAFKLVECGFIGINRSYVDMSNKNYFMWDRASGSNTRDSFNTLFDNSTNNTIIISKAIADYIGVTKLGQKVRIVFAEKGQNQYDGYAQTMTVVGITGGMPGFWNFRSSKFSANGGGVMISLDNYFKWMKQGSIDNKSTPIDKILINLQNTDKDSISDIKSLINDLYGEKYDFIIDDNISKIGLFNQGDQTIDLIMQIILTLTIIIALFGLLSTIYSSLLERMFEVGLLRAMGLRSSNVRGIFIAESLISMLAAGTLGMLIGVFIAYMLVSNAGMITEMPTPFTIEVGTLIRTYLISITISVIGVIFITRKIKKWSIMDIFRQTF